MTIFDKLTLRVEQLKRNVSINKNLILNSMTDSEKIESFWVSNGGSPHVAADIDFYESDWNMLMPVVEKIESMYDDHHGYFGVYINSNSCTIQGTKFRTDKIADPPVIFYQEFGVTKINSTHKAVANFIDWYETKH